MNALSLQFLSLQFRPCDEVTVRGQLAQIKIPIPVAYSRGDDFDLVTPAGK